MVDHTDKRTSVQFAPLPIGKAYSQKNSMLNIEMCSMENTPVYINKVVIKFGISKCFKTTLYTMTLYTILYIHMSSLEYFWHVYVVIYISQNVLIIQTRVLILAQILTLMRRCCGVSPHPHPSHKHPSLSRDL